jgi:hypothetical protein
MVAIKSGVELMMRSDEWWGSAGQRGYRHAKSRRNMWHLLTSYKYLGKSQSHSQLHDSYHFVNFNWSILVGYKEEDMIYMH